MAILQDLIDRIPDSALRERIAAEVDKLFRQKKFGLVFEEHLPECTPLYKVPIRVGSKVARKVGYVSDLYLVERIDGEMLLCVNRKTHEQKSFHRDELVAAAEFGEPIYPTLQPVDVVENAPESDLWHTLIEADNPAQFAAAAGEAAPACADRRIFLKSGAYVQKCAGATGKQGTR